MWRNMCFALGLRPAVADTISATHCGNPKQCLREVIIKWLRKTYDVDRHGPPTWRTLVKAVSDRAGGDNPALAEEIAKGHTGISTSWGLAMAIPFCVLLYLYTACRVCIKWLWFEVIRMGGRWLHTQTIWHVVSTQHRKDASCSSDSCPGYVAKYADYLREKYRRLPIFPGKSEWPPPVAKYDTQVALIEREEYPQNSRTAAEDMGDIVVGRVDRILSRKHRISAEEIFAPAKTGHELKVLIDGAPGVGKTILTRRFVKDWAEGKLLSAYDFVLLLELRDRRIAQASCISELFCHDDPQLRQQVVDYVCKTMGANIMLIFDGFDELSLSQRKELLNIICGEKLLHCSVIVTSRPYASEAIQRLRCLSRHVEVLGFTEQQIEHCITNSIADTEKAQALIQQLRERQDLISLCYIPLNCSIMVFVYKHKFYTLPDTITQLYEAFLVNTLKRHVDRYDEELGKRVRSLDRLPDSQLQACLQGLTKLAYKGLENDQSTFYIEELEAELSRTTPEGDLHSKLLGVMNVFRSTSGVGIEESYQFLHRTVQEFLAAKHASELPENDQLSFFKEHVVYLDTVVVFLAGLTKLALPAYQQYFESEVSHTAITEIPDYDETEFTYDQWAFLQHLHLVYEAQNTELCRLLPKCVENQKIAMIGSHLSPFNCRVLTYCLINSSCCWKSLDLRDCRLSDRCLQAIKNVQPSGMCGSIKELVFYSDKRLTSRNSSRDNVFTFAGLSLLPNIPLFQDVKFLKLCSCCMKPGNESREGFAKLLQMKSLVSLFMMVKPKSFVSYLNVGLQERELVACKLLECPTKISRSLQTLSLTILRKSELDEMECIATSLGNSNLTNLELCIRNNLVPHAGLSVMLPSLLSMKAIEELSLHLFRPYSPIPPTSDASMPSFVHGHPQFVLSELEGLQEMLETSGTLKSLKLFIDQVMTKDDVRYLTKGLSVNQPLTSLTLYSACHEFTDLSAIYQALQQKKNLERLFIRASHRCAMWPVTDHNPESGLSDLQEALKSNVSLQNMSLIGVGDTEVKYIADGLIDHPSLKSIELIDVTNSVLQTSHVARLLRALHSCPALHSVFVSSGLTACCLDGATNGHGDISHNPVSESETGDLIGASLLQGGMLTLDFFTHLHSFQHKRPSLLRNTRLIVESLFKKLVAHYPFLKHCGFAMLQFHGHHVFTLFKFEPVQDGEPGGLNSNLLPMEWESVDRIASFETIRAYLGALKLREGGYSGHEQQWTAYIGIRIIMDNKRVDLLLKVVEGVCWMRHLGPGEVFMEIPDIVGIMATNQRFTHMQSFPSSPL